MTKGELIEIIAQREDFNLKRAEMVVNAVFGTMSNALEQGDRVEIRGFGSFEVRTYDAYTGEKPEDWRDGVGRSKTCTVLQNRQRTTASD